MEVLAKARFVRRTPRKARLVADLVRGLKVDEALTTLEFTPRHAAVDVAKAVKSAAANAEHNHSLSRDELFVKTIMVDDGPRIKRFRPASRGMAHPYAHRTCHITVVVEDRPDVGRPARRARPRPAPAPEPEPELQDELKDELQDVEATAPEAESSVETAEARAEETGTGEPAAEAAEPEAEESEASEDEGAQAVAENADDEEPEKKPRPRSARKDEGVE